MASKGKNFTGTVNNPTVSLEEFMAVLKRLPNVVAARAQLEKGENGTPHFQWMVSMSKEQRHNKMTQLLPKTHIEKARNAFAAWNYCGKEDTRLEGPLEFGVPPAAKNVKGDTKARNQLIIEQGPVKAVEEGLIPLERFHQLVSSMNLYTQMKKEVKTLDKLQNEWHWGHPGTGKSRGVRTRFPEAYIKSNNLWWDAYQGETVVIIEEMGPQQIGAHWIKQWADHYPFKADAKRSYMTIRPERVIVTSNYSIRECYPNKQDYEAIERRFQVHHYPAPIGN